MKAEVEFNDESGLSHVHKFDSDHFVLLMRGGSVTLQVYDGHELTGEAHYGELLAFRYGRELDPVAV